MDQDAAPVLYGEETNRKAKLPYPDYSPGSNGPILAAQQPDHAFIAPCKGATLQESRVREIRPHGLTGGRRLLTLSSLLLPYCPSLRIIGSDPGGGNDLLLSGVRYIAESGIAWGAKKVSNILISVHSGEAMRSLCPPPFFCKSRL